jgi:hypothetical protein
MRRLLRLYPRRWRERYGDEFAALLEELGPTPALIGDIVRGAFVAHFDRFVERPADGGVRRWMLTGAGDAVVRKLIAVLALSTTLTSFFGPAMVVRPLGPEVMTAHALAVIPLFVSIAVGGLTLVAVLAPAPGPQSNRRFVCVAGLVLAAAGIVGAINVLELGRLTGDYEWGIANVHVALVVQGVLTALYFSDRLGGRGLLAS